MSPEAVPVVSVTLTEDRATVTRSAVVQVPGGPHTLVVQGVSPLVVEDSLRVTADGARVTRVDLARKWRTPPPPGTVGSQGIHALLDDLEARVWHTTSQVQRASARATGAAQRLATVCEALGTAALQGTIDGEAATASYTRAGSQVLDRVEHLSDTLASGRALARELDLLSSADDGTRSPPRLTTELRIHLDAPEACAVPLSIRYLVPAALWRPSYEAVLHTGAGQETTLALRLVATAWQRTGESWDDVEVTLSTARPSTSAELPPLHEDTLQAREKTRAEARTIDASFRDQALQSASLTEGGAQGALPGVDDGGEARVFRPAHPVSIPSDGRARRMVVAQMSVPATIQRRCIPALVPAAVYSATAQNTLTVPGGGPVPLMAGPVLLIRADGTCVGTGTLPFVAPGERFELGFGSEDDVVVTHKRGRRTEARFARKGRTWFTSTTTLKSVSGTPVHLEVQDRVPVSDLPELTIHVAPAAPEGPTRSGPDSHGHVRWTVTLQPGATLDLEVAFSIEKPDRVNLPDPW